MHIAGDYAFFHRMKAASDSGQGIPSKLAFFPRMKVTSDSSQRVPLKLYVFLKISTKSRRISVFMILPDESTA